MPNKQYEYLNFFENNRAPFGNDYCSFPHRLKYKNPNFDSFHNITIPEIEIIPNIETVGFVIEIVDFYGQNMNKINNR